MSEPHSSAAQIKAQIDHPVVDSDGHWIEYGPHATKALRQIGGEAAAEGFLHFGRGITRTVGATLAERVANRQAQDAWWVLPTRNTRDRATVMMPDMLASRLNEFGIDFAVIYPTAGLGLPQIPEERMRRSACSAFNTYTADYFGAHATRMTPAAVIPMHTPREAVEELEHVHELGLKTVMLGSLVRRRIPDLERSNPALADQFPWLDVIGIDSPYDYDPVWRRCMELGFSPTFHSNARGRAFGLRNSPSNFVFNHIGHFAASADAICKALMMGGVTHRFPHLNFGFLEGGAGWACQLLCDLVGHWEKRNLDALTNVNPANLDHEAFLDFARDFARDDFLELLEAGTDEIPANRRTVCPQEGLDDFSACSIESTDDLVAQFASRFYFGCEADDPINAWAFKRETLPHRAQLKTLFGSDIGHFDVPDMAGVLPEAFELVDDGLISLDDFRGFVFENAVHFLSENNRQFFAGTAVETQVQAYWQAHESSRSEAMTGNA